MFYAYTNTSQALTANTAITFATNGLNTCSYVRHTAGSTDINLLGTGEYLVSFNGDLAATATADTNLSVQLYVNDTLYPGAEATATSTAATDIVNIGFTTVVKTYPNCYVIKTNLPAVLTVVNGDNAATASNVAIMVVKVK